MENQQITDQQTIDKSLPKATALLKDAWQIYRSRFWVLIGLLLIPALATILVMFGPIILGVFPKFYTNLYILLPAITLSIVLIMILSLWCWLALLYAIRDRSEAIGIKESLRRAWGKQILSFWWIGILEFFTILGGFILLVVPAIIFAVWFSLSSFVFVTEGQRGFNAFLRSKEYVQGRWWSVFRRLLIIIFFWLVLYLIVFSINFVVSKNIADIISVIINILLWPLILVYLFLLYDALRELRPQLFGQPVTAKKGFFVFASILGPIAIIVLPTLILVGLSNVRKEVRDAKRIVDLIQVQIILENTYIEAGRYPSTLPGQDFYYGVSSDSRSYVLGITLEKKDNPALKDDVDGLIYGINCDDPIYCVKS